MNLLIKDEKPKKNEAPDSINLDELDNEIGEMTKHRIA